MIDLQYAYLVGTVLLPCFLWLVMFYLRPDLRKQMVVFGLLIGLTSPLSEIWHHADYWQPQYFNGWKYGIEDFLFGFSMGGIASVIYEELLGRHYARRLDRRFHWSWFIFPTVVLIVMSMNYLIFSFGVNSMHATFLVFVGLALTMAVFRHDLLLDSVVSGVAMGILMFCGYMFFLFWFPNAIQAMWKLDRVSGVSVAGIPIEEFLWAFAWGMYMSFIPD
ncbi:MAG: lycopene cyclase domain-containing protein [Patescibacteria group bacterium]|nr:lycopene cyclase domain-containing protein [Patescibacteria group bacterium]